MFKNTTFVPGIILFLALLGFATFVAMDVVETPVAIPQAAVQNKITTDCKDGTCYDPATGKEIGNDPEVPIHLTLPVQPK